MDIQMHGCKDGCTNVGTDACMHGCMHVWMHVWMHACVDACMDARMDGRDCEPCVQGWAAAVNLGSMDILVIITYWSCSHISYDN